MKPLRNLFLVQMNKEDKFQAFTLSLSSSAAKSLAVSALSSKFSMSMSSSAMLFVPLFPRIGTGASFFPELPHLSQTSFFLLLVENRNASIWISCSPFFHPDLYSPELFFSLTKSFLSHRIAWRANSVRTRAPVAWTMCCCWHPTVSEDNGKAPWVVSLWWV